MLKIIMELVCIFVFAVLGGCNDALDERTEERYYVQGGVLINNEQGYSYEVPEGFTLNEEYYPFNLRLEGSDTVIEIYVEENQSTDMVQSYIGYTNKAITNNAVDYYDVKEKNLLDTSVLMWSRDKLERIENDKNHYLKIDVTKGLTVYTILVKSEVKQEDYKIYLDAFETIKKRDGYEETVIKRQSADREFNSETEEMFNRYFENSEALAWGIFQPDYHAADSIKSIEEKINYEFDFLLWYTEFQKEYDASKVRTFLDKAYSDNKIVEMTLQPLLYHEEGNDIFRVLNGYYDDFLDAFSKDFADFEHPVIFRLANEMNGDWCEYSAYRMSLDTELYREMYRYVYSFFKKNNADNVIWVWNPNGKSFPDFNWNAEEMYYPGDGYVDVLGLTLYNTGNFYPGENWTGFSDLYTDLYNESLDKYDMPFMITEFSCARAGGDKEEWTKEMLKNIERLDNIKVAVWWNSADYTPEYEVSRSYFIDDSEEMLDIFNEYFSKRK